MSQKLLPEDLPVLFGHTTAVLVLLTTCYYLLPARSPTEPQSLARLAGSLLALGVLLLVLRREVRRSRRTLSPGMHRVQWLLTALYVLVLAFALVYAAMPRLAPGQMVGIDDRTDALYFSVTLVSTVGFGDIHAVGSWARAVVTVHMVFNLIYLGTALRLLSSAPRAAQGDGPA